MHEGPAAVAARLLSIARLQVERLHEGDMDGFLALEGEAAHEQARLTEGPSSDEEALVYEELAGVNQSLGAMLAEAHAAAREELTQLKAAREAQSAYGPGRAASPDGVWA